MKQAFYTLAASIFLTSCATIVNLPYKYVTVHTAEPSRIIFEHDTVSTVGNKAHLKVKRKNEPLPIIVAADSSTKLIRVEPKNSVMYWSNIYFNCGLGMLVDRKNPKRYTYPDKIYINSAAAKSSYSIYGQANNKGELYLHISLPLINHFLMKPENEGAKTNVGTGGGTFGLDYYHSEKQFIHLGILGSSGVTTGGISSQSWYLETLGTDYISLSNNHKIGRFATGYGLSLARNVWEYGEFISIIPIEIIKKRYYALGLMFPNYFQIEERFYVGVIYKPTFYRPNMTNKFAYEHLVSIDVAWKIRLKR